MGGLSQAIGGLLISASRLELSSTVAGGATVTSDGSYTELTGDLSTNICKACTCLTAELWSKD